MPWPCTSAAGHPGDSSFSPLPLYHARRCSSLQLGLAGGSGGSKAEERDAALALAVPVGAVGAWAVYLRLRIGLESGVAQVQELGLPFVGFGQAFEGWMAEPLDLAVGVVIMILLVLFTRRVVTSEHLVGWAFVGFVALGLLFTRQVWQSYYDITRAIAPAVTAFVLLLFAPQDPVERTGVGS